MFFPIHAVVAGGLVLAAQSVPTFNVDPSCRAAAREGTPANATENSMSICRDIEQKARQEIVKQWSQVSAADKAQCVPLSNARRHPDLHRAARLHRADP